jgi:uncharacterized protein
MEDEVFQPKPEERWIDGRRVWVIAPNLEPEAEKGNPAAQNLLGIHYLRGEVVEQNLDEAFKWFMKAAEQGYSEAQLNIGKIHADGEGVSQDYKKAEFWYLKAAT